MPGDPGRCIRLNPARVDSPLRLCTSALLTGISFGVTVTVYESLFYNMKPRGNGFAPIPPFRRDLVTIGETMLRLMVPDGLALENVRHFDVEVAGAESNVAVALARLGHQVAWVSALPANGLGHLVANSIRQHGVDISTVRWCGEDVRIGTYYWEPARPPRVNRVIYDRENSAFSSMSEEDVNWDFVGRSRYLHLTGITPALSSRALAIVTKAIKLAATHDQVVTFDLNFRSHLWSPAACADAVTPLLPAVDVLFCSARDADSVLGIHGDPTSQARTVAEQYGSRTVVITAGACGAVAWDGEAHAIDAVPADAVDPVGRGDAFVAGFMHGLLVRGDGDVDFALECGAALAGLQQTYVGDVAWARARDVEELLARAKRDMATTIISR